MKTEESKKLLPVGTRIQFLETLYGPATSESPACVYAYRGDKGVVTGHGAKEGHWVKWDKWPHAFGSVYGTEFVEIEESFVDCPVCNGTGTSKVSNRKCSRCNEGKITKELADLLAKIRGDVGRKLDQSGIDF